MQLLAKTDVKALRQFAWQMAIAIPLLFAVFLPWLFSWQWPLWPFYLAVILLLFAAIYPRGLYYPYRLWMAFATVMGWLNTRILLGLVFYVLMLPIGLVLRLTGKLQYQRTPNAASYWQTPDKESTAKDLENPF